MVLVVLVVISVANGRAAGRGGDGGAGHDDLVLLAGLGVHTLHHAPVKREGGGTGKQRVDTFFLTTKINRYKRTISIKVKKKIF